MAGTQTLEGAASGYAGLELAGGLGLGVFQPSLTLQALEGTQSLTSFTSTVTLDFEVTGSLTLGPGFWAGTSSHQGAVTQFLTPGDKTVEIDVHSLGFSLNARFAPSEVLTLRAQVLRETDDLYQVQNSARTKTTPLSQTSTLTAANLGIEWSLVEKLSFEVSAEGGVEELPAGSVYSPVLGETLFFSSPTAPFFTGYAAGLIYYF